MTACNIAETLQHIRKIISRWCNFEVGHIRIYGYMIRVIIYYSNCSNFGGSQLILAVIIDYHKSQNLLMMASMCQREGITAGHRSNSFSQPLPEIPSTLHILFISPFKHYIKGFIR